MHKKYNKTIHLEEAELENSFNRCPFCNSENSKRIGTIQESPLISALVCEHCHIGFANRQPMQKALNEYYANYYINSDRNTTIKEELLIKHLSAHTIIGEERKEFDILDFGGGDGSISYGLAQHILKTNKIKDVNIFVIDPNFKKLENVSSNINIHNLSSIESIPVNKKFDFVIASAILEHIKHPRIAITQLFRVMKPSAIFYARTPYLFPFKALLGKIGFNLSVMGFPAHLFDMGSKFWDSILSTLNQEKKFHVLISKTSLVETSVKENFFGWFIANTFKLPSRIWKNYHFVGGWEVFIEKKVYNTK